MVPNLDAKIWHDLFIESLKYEKLVLNESQGVSWFCSCFKILAEAPHTI